MSSACLLCSTQPARSSLKEDAVTPRSSGDGGNRVCDEMLAGDAIYFLTSIAAVVWRAVLLWLIVALLRLWTLDVSSITDYSLETMSSEDAVVVLTAHCSFHHPATVVLQLR